MIFEFEISTHAGRCSVRIDGPAYDEPGALTATGDLAGALNFLDGACGAFGHGLALFSRRRGSDFLCLEGDAVRPSDMGVAVASAEASPSSWSIRSAKMTKGVRGRIKGPPPGCVF